MSSARSGSAVSRSWPSHGVSGGHGRGLAGGSLAPRGTHPVPSAGIDGWLSLVPVDPDGEVQGEIHLELRVPEQVPGHPRVLRCHLIEARWEGGSGA